MAVTVASGKRGTFKGTSAVDTFIINDDTKGATITNVGGGDIIAIEGFAADFTAKVSGRVVTLTSTVDTGVVIKFQLAATSGTASIRFLDGDLTATHTAKVGKVAAFTTLGTQKLTAKAVAVSDETLGTNDSVTTFDETAGGGSSSTGTTFTLTTDLDNKVGTSGDDTFSGTVIAVGGTGTTAQAGDVISGGTGTDTFNLSIAGAGAAFTVSALSLTGVEKVLLNNFDTDGGITTVDTSLFTGVTTVGVSASSATGDTTFTNLAAVTAAELKNGSGDLTLTYTAAAVAGTADVQALALQGVTAGTVVVNGVETVAVTNALVASALTALTTDAATITVNASAALDLGAALAGTAKTVNAAASTAGVTLITSTATDATITGGSGNDSITTGTAVGAGTTVNAGTGTDTLALTADAITTALIGARYTGFETLAISQAVAATATRAQDLSLVSGLTTAAITTLADTANGGGDNTQTVNFTNASATVTGLAISGLASVEAANFLTGAVSLTRATDTTADSITLTLGTATASAGATATVAAGTAKVINVTLNNEETISVVSQGAANFLGTLTSADATTINVSGSKALSIASISAASLATLNASTMTANLNIAANTSAVASTITGGSGNDSLVGGTLVDSISGGAGNDTIVAGAGADVLVGGAGDDTLQGQAGSDNVSGGDGDDTVSVVTVGDFVGLAAAETVSGGAGNDTLAFSQAATTITIAATDLTALSGVENISINGTSSAGSITLSDAVYTANGVANLAIVDGDLTTAGGTLTVAASALTGTNAITVTANTATGINDNLVGGAGNDTFTFATVAGLETGDTVNGGAGTDTISVDASAAATLVMTATTNIEKITTTGNGTGTVTVDLLEANITTAVAATASAAAVAVGSMTFNASTLTNGTGVVDYDGSLVTTITKVQNLTGSAGADTLTGGSGDDIIVGGDGADTITGGVGVDNLAGGDGADQFNVGLTAQFVGLATAEVVSGGAGNDTLRISTGATSIAVAAVDLAGINSIETISIVNAAGQTASVTLTDAVFTANGATTLAVTNLAASNAGINVTASALTAANSVQFTGTTTAAVNDTLVGGAGNDTFTFSTAVAAGALDANDTVTGGLGNDTLVISTGTTALTGVTLTGVTGIEAISVTGTTGGVGTITLTDANFATITAATINASALTTGALLVTAAAEDDSTFSITGGAGADNITGGQLADTISAGGGADTITGGLFADSLSGGLGVDTFVYALVTESNSTRTDSITDFVTGVDKINVVLNYSTFTTGITVDATVQTAAAGVAAAQDALSGDRGQAIYDTTASVLYVNANADNLLTSSDYKIAVNAASTAASSIVTGDINNIITGGSGADSITAGGGADTITGGSGADTITGGTGNDSIVLTEGVAAVDILSWATGAGMDTVTGFTVGAGGDQVNAGISSAGATVTLVSSANNTDALTLAATDEVLVLRTVDHATFADLAAVKTRLALDTENIAASDNFYVVYSNAAGVSQIARLTTDAVAGIGAGDTLEDIVQLVGSANTALITVANFTTVA